MEFKWLFIGISVMWLCIMAGLAIDNVNSMNCRLTLAQAGRTPADIKEICK